MRSVHRLFAEGDRFTFSSRYGRDTTLEGRICREGNLRNQGSFSRLIFVVSFVLSFVETFALEPLETDKACDKARDKVVRVLKT
jgi:hypothetical protein